MQSVGSGISGIEEQRQQVSIHYLLEDLPLLKGKRGGMKLSKKKTNKDRDKGIVWCMAEIYAMKLVIKSLIKWQKETDTKLSNSHKD